jgi:hypothetical protein
MSKIMKRSARMLLVIVLIASVIPLGCQTRSRSIRGTADGNVRYPQPIPAVIYAENGSCPTTYPFCLTAEGFDAFEGSLDDLGLCEGSLKECQAALDKVPRDVEIVIEERVVYRTEWWKYFLGGVLFIAGGVIGWAIGDKLSN